MRHRARNACAAAVFAASFCVPVRAAEIDGVYLPGTVEAAGKTLHLNGYGLRTYSWLGVHVYVAALYLEHPATNGEAILRSPETKLLTFLFKRSVSAETARDAWRNGIERNCQPPCQLDPGELAQFLAGVPAMHEGERFTILFTRAGAYVTAGDRPYATVPWPQFAEAMLGAFLGPEVEPHQLKEALLQGHS